MDISKIKGELGIDEYNLQREWLRQSELTINYSSLTAEIRKKRDLTNRKIAVRRAELYTEVRANPGKFFSSPPDRITEAMVDSIIEQDKLYNDLQKKCIDYEYRQQMSRNMVDALLDKRKSLEAIQELILSGLYAEPKNKSELEIRKAIQQKERSNKKN